VDRLAGRAAEGPLALARRQGRRAEPFAKFATVAGKLGGDCLIQVAWQGTQAVGAAISLHTAGTAIGWRLYADRSLPARYRLTEVLIAESLRHACEAGCQYLEMGESGGKEDLAGLKSRYGGRAFPLAEYHYERIPLSPARAAFASARKRAKEFVVARTSRH